jgi:hypothetical protein
LAEEIGRIARARGHLARARLAQEGRRDAQKKYGEAEKHFPGKRWEQISGRPERRDLTLRWLSPSRPSSDGSTSTPSWQRLKERSR